MVFRFPDMSFPPNKNTTLLAVPAPRFHVGEGSLAVSRVIQDPPGVSRISVESSLVNDLPPVYCAPPVTSRTVSPLSLIKLEQAWRYRLWFKEGRYSTRPDGLYLATVGRHQSGAVLSCPPVTT